MGFAESVSQKGVIYFTTVQESDKENQVKQVELQNKVTDARLDGPAVAHHSHTP